MLNIRSETWRRFLRGHSFSTYGIFSEKLTFLTTWYVHTCAYRGVKNLSFSEKSAYVVNGWSLGIVKTVWLQKITGDFFVFIYFTDQIIPNVCQFTVVMQIGRTKLTGYKARAFLKSLILIFFIILVNFKLPLPKLNYFKPIKNSFSW